MFVQLFGRCTIEPIGDSNGNKVYPDLNTMENAGIIVAPGPYQVKFSKRSNSLL
jgi:hypothetical protein